MHQILQEYLEAGRRQQQNRMACMGYAAGHDPMHVEGIHAAHHKEGCMNLETPTISPRHSSGCRDRLASAAAKAPQ
jgi:hypothetical protein